MRANVTTGQAQESIPAERPTWFYRLATVAYPLQYLCLRVVNNSNHSLPWPDCPEIKGDEGDGSGLGFQDKMKLDIAKIHNEVNQLRMCELLCCSFAIGFVGASAETLAGDPIAGLLVVGMLALLFFWHTALTDVRSRLTIYLRLKKLSQWEEDWRAFADKSPEYGQRRVGCLLFFWLTFAPLIARGGSFVRASWSGGDGAEYLLRVAFADVSRLWQAVVALISAVVRDPGAVVVVFVLGVMAYLWRLSGRISGKAKKRSANRSGMGEEQPAAGSARALSFLAVVGLVVLCGVIVLCLGMSAVVVGVRHPAGWLLMLATYVVSGWILHRGTMKPTGKLNAYANQWVEVLKEK